MKKQKDRKKYNISKLDALYWISFFVGIVFTFTGIVFWIVLALVLNQGIDNIDSKTYSIYYYLSIVAVTIGLGMVTIGFSLRGAQNRKTDKSDDLKKNTVNVLKEYNQITSTPNSLYVKEVLNDFAKEWSLDTIESTFVEDPSTYFDKYLQLINTPKNDAKEASYDFASSLIDICKKNCLYFAKDEIPDSDDAYIIRFLSCCAEILKKFEALCYEYCNERVTLKVFESDVLVDIKKYLLRGYIVVNYYHIESELTYLRLSLLKEKNKDNIILEEE